MRNLYLALILFFIAVPVLAQTLYSGTTYNSPLLDGCECENAVFSGTAFRVQLPGRVYHAGANDELSCFGTNFQVQTGVLTRIEPQSDLYGKASVGDIILTIDNESPWQNVSNRHNYGQAGSVAEFVIRNRAGQVYTVECSRQPVSVFSPDFQRTLLGL